MEFDYVYADLQVQVLLDADGTSPFGQLTDNEVEILGKLLYMTLTSFNWLRAMNAKNAVEFAKRMDRTRQDGESKPDGG